MSLHWLMEKLAKVKVKEKDKRRVEYAAGAVGAGALAKDRILGQKTVYHGTSKENWEKIKHEGLKADRGGIGGASEAVDSEDFIKRSKGKVHVTGMKTNAKAFGTYSGIGKKHELEHEKRVSSHWNKEGPGHYSTKLGVDQEKAKKIMSESRRIKEKNYAKDFAKSMFLKNKGKVITAKIPFAEYKKMKPDPDMVPGPFTKSRFANHIAATTDKDIPVEAIKGGKAKLADKVKYIGRNLPGYIKSHPGRFGTGLALAGGAGYLAHKALEKKAELNKDVKLYPHQQRVVDNPATSQIIAHAVGSGKTLTSIAKFEKMKQDGKAKKALVIVPAGLRDNFGHSNVKKFTNSKYNIVGTQQEIKKKTHAGIDPTSDYNIMSYEIFKRNPEKYLKDSGADTVIADESHRGKNEDTKLTKALKRARKLYANHIGLTGSVVSNSLADIHPLVDVASGGQHSLGKNKKEFESRYVRRSNAPQYRDLPVKRRPVVGFKNENELKKNLSANIDYADFEDIKDLANMPDKNLKVKKVPLSKEQVKLYKQLLAKNPKVMQMIKMKRLETLKDEEAASAFSSLVEARKLMNSIGSIKPGMSLEDSAEATPKTKKLLDDLSAHLGSRKDAKALLFSHLISGGVDTLEAGLKQRHIPYGRFIGKGNPGSTEEIRQQDVNDYNEGKKKVMLVSSAGGEGLSLNDTTWEGVLDPHYNPEKMKQMEARGIRSGGLASLPKAERHVDVNRYLSTMPAFMGVFHSSIKTPDEFIYEIASHKDAQNQRLFKLLKGVQARKKFDTHKPKPGEVFHSSTPMPQQSNYSVD